MEKKVKYNFSKCVDSCGAKGHYFIVVREMPF